MTVSTPSRSVPRPPTHSLATQDSNETKIAEIHARIQTQRKIMEGYQSLRGATPNQDVIRQAEAQIRDAQRNISYLEESLRAIQGRRSSGGAGIRNQSSSGTTTPNTGFFTPAPVGTPAGRGHMDPASDGRSVQSSNGPPSFTSSNSFQGSFSGASRPYPGDSSSSYQTSSNSDLHGGAPVPGVMGNMRRPDDRGSPNAPGSFGGGEGPRGPMQGGFRGPGGAGYGTPPPPPGKGGPMVNRMGTNSKRAFTNLGERQGTRRGAGKRIC